MSTCSARKHVEDVSGVVAAAESTHGSRARRANCKPFALDMKNHDDPELGYGMEATWERMML